MKSLAAHWYPAVLVAIVMALCLLSYTTPAHSYPTNQCAADRYGSNLNCTSNDVGITNIRIVGDVTSCTGGTTVPLDLEITVNFATPNRWDIGVFVPNDGKSAQNTSANGGAASCSVGILPTTSPFLNLDNDGCGDGNKDINGGTGNGFLYMTGATVLCQAVSGSNGYLYIPFAVSWDNQASPAGGTCNTIADTVPNNAAKCTLATVDYGKVTVVVMPSITNTDGLTFVNSGDSVNYTVVITNTTGVSLSGAVFKDPEVTGIDVTSDPIQCSASGGASCPADLTKASMQGVGITIPNMPAGSSVTFTITATLTGAPPDTRTNTASVTVGGQTKSASDTDRIVGTIAIIPTTISQYGTPGTLMVFNYTLYNFGGLEDDITLTAASNQGWTWQIWNDAGTKVADNDPGTPEPSTAVVENVQPGGGTKNFIIKVQIPSSPAPDIGTIDTTTITATSGNNPSKTATATAVTTVSGPLTLTPNNESAGGQSSSVFYDHRVQNNTASSPTVTFTMTFTGPSCTNWTYVAPSFVTLSPFGGYADVTARVNIPSTAAINDTCTVTVRADSSSGDIATATDTTTVKGIVLYSDPSYTDESYIYPAGSFVYARIFGTLSRPYKFYWYDSSGALRTTSACYTGPGTLSNTYPPFPEPGIPDPFGTWQVVVRYDNTSPYRCDDVTASSPTFAQTNFYVGPDHLNATYTGANPSVGSTISIPITLHDRYSNPHTIPLDPTTGNVVSGNPPTTKDPLKITVTVSGSATITAYCNDPNDSSSCTSIAPAQTVTFNLPASGALKGTATIKITDSVRETVTITPDTYNSALYGSSIAAPNDRDESAQVTFVRRRMRILIWREVQ